MSRGGLPGRRPPGGAGGAARAAAGVPAAAGAGGRRARHGHRRVPGRPLKVFVTASAEERARRRHKQLIEKGISVNIDSLLRDIRERDARDAAPGGGTARARCRRRDPRHDRPDDRRSGRRVLALYRAPGLAASRSRRRRRRRECASGSVVQEAAVRAL